MKDEAEAIAGEPHALQLTAWDLPSAIGAGERFRAAIGAKCSAGCNLGGRELVLFDHEGSWTAAVKLGPDVWPGTEALYFSEVEAMAPVEIGTYQWEAKIAGWDTEPPHAACSCPVSVRVVGAPECEVTVKAVDRETQAPIKGACVVMHPYRATTDESGIAKIWVARGQYDILVSGSRYMPVYASVEVSADLTTSAELEVDQPWVHPEEVME